MFQNYDSNRFLKGSSEHFLTRLTIFKCSWVDADAFFAFKMYSPLCIFIPYPLQFFISVFRIRSKETNNWTVKKFINVNCINSTMKQSLTYWTKLAFFLLLGHFFPPRRCR